MTGKPQVKDEMELPIISSTTEHNMSDNLIVKVSDQPFHQELTTSAEKIPEVNVVAEVDSKMQLLNEMSVLEATTSSGVSAASNKTSEIPELLEDQLTCAICQEILYNSIR